MRKLSTRLFLFLLGSYVLLHLILGSSPVQKRVVAELQQALKEYGLSLQMESIEFSAFSPKIYLNRVKLEATPEAKISLAEPLSIDKIKIQFRPLSLLFRRIAIDELILFHPRIQVPQADKLYRTAMGLFGSKGAIKVARPSWDVLFYKMGVVDALFNIESKEPPFAVRSRSLTFIVEKGSGQQRSIEVQSPDLELVWDKFGLNLTRIDVDLDLGADSFRLNKGTLENGDFSLNLLGVSRMPTETEKIPRTFNASFDLKAKLEFLKTIPWIHAPKFAGSVATSGTVKKNGLLYSGKGQASYDKVTVDGYEIGTGSLGFALDKRKLGFSQVDLRYAKGDFRSSNLSLELGDHFPIQGDLSYQGLLLEGILRAVGVEKPPVAMQTSGHIKVSGTLVEPFRLNAQLDSKMNDLVVVDDSLKPPSAQNSLIEFGGGPLKGLLTFTKDKMDFDAELGVLDGKVKGRGFVGFDDTSHVQAKGEGVSLTKLRRIASLDLAGTANLTAEVVVNKKEGYVSGSFDAKDAKVEDLELGSVSGDAFYEADLLTFENLLLPSLEPVRGNGFVDFKGKGTRYKFYVNAHRTETDQIFAVLRRLKMNFEIPKHGEVNSRITVEGGEDGEGVRVSASGQAKNFLWFNEKWATAAFALNYHDSVVELTKVLLTKPSGALEVRGQFAKTTARLQLATFGLEVSQFERFGKAPLSGEISGQVLFEGAPDNLFHHGKGELKLTKTKFRGLPVPDSTIKLRPEGTRLEYLFNFGGDRMRGRFMRSENGHNDELLVYFQDYDFAPAMTLLLSRDVPPLADLRATGDLSVTGNFDKPDTLAGSGTVNQMSIGFKGTPMKLLKPAQIKMDKSGIRVDSLFLQGEDSQLSLAFNLEPERKVDARLDGRIDLQYLQPFIPGLEYGAGKVSVGLRMSGPPAKFQLLGNLSLEGGSFKLQGFSDEFKAVETRLSVSQDRINVDRFESMVNGGVVSMDGEVRLDRFRLLNPNLRIHADKVTMHLQDYLSGKLTGDFYIRGKERPYQFGGRCEIQEAMLTRFQSQSSSTNNKTDPLFSFDLQCLGTEKLMVATDIVQAEFRGNFHVVGDNVDLGLLGSAEAIRGLVVIKDTKFNLETANVKFESPTTILPRFRVAGRTNVREVRSSGTMNQGAGTQEFQSYEVNLQASGIPTDYKIHLTSTPPLLESELVSLLVLGVTSRSQQGGSLSDLGGALVNQIPLQKKMKNEYGLEVKMGNTAQAGIQQGSSLNPGSANADAVAPTVQIQKSITEKTKLSYTNTLDVTVPLKELRIEQMLDDHVTVNATTLERTRGGASTPTQAYGLDVRYRFQFE